METRTKRMKKMTYYQIKLDGRWLTDTFDRRNHGLPALDNRAKWNDQYNVWWFLEGQNQAVPVAYWKVAPWIDRKYDHLLGTTYKSLRQNGKKQEPDSVWLI